MDIPKKEEESFVPNVDNRDVPTNFPLDMIPPLTYKIYSFNC